MTVAQIVDANDVSSVLFDFNLSSGVGNPGSVKTGFGAGGVFGLGAPSLETGQFNPSNAPGGFTVYDRDPLVAMTWPQRIYSTSYDNFVEGVGKLAQLLRLGGVMKTQMTGQSSPRYIDFEPSPAPALLNGRPQELLGVLTYLDTLRGIDLMVWRQPYLRTGVLDSTTNLLVNSTLLLDGGASRPANWTWVSTTNITSESIVPLQEAYQFTIAVAAERSLRQSTTAATAAPGDVWTGSFYAKQNGSDTNCKAAVRIEWLDNLNAVISTETGTLTSLTTSWQRLTLTTNAAPASTDHIRITLLMSNSSATSFTVQWRFAQLEKATSASLFHTGAETVDNDPASGFGRVYPIYVNGDAPSPVNLKFTVGAAAKVVEIRVGEQGNDNVTGRRGIVDYLNDKSYAQADVTGNGWTVALSNDTTQVADGSTSGGNMAQTTYATVATMAKRSDISRTASLDCLRGVWDVWVRVKATAAAKHVLQLRWAASLADPAGYSEPEVVLDTTGFTAFQYEMVKLGRIYIPEAGATLGGIEFELWSRRDSGTGNLNWDFIQLVPANDRLAVVQIPGSYSEEWLGSSMGTAPTNPGGLSNGTVEDQLVALDAAGEAAGNPPNAGIVWGTGRHRVTFSIQNSFLVSTTVTLRVRNITDSTTTITTDVTLTKGQKLDYTLQFDGVAAKSYQAQVAWGSGSKMWVSKITHRFVTGVGSGQSIYTDPDNYSIAVLDASSSLIVEVAGKGDVPIRLTPGLHILAVMFGDGPQALHDLPENLITRTPVMGHVTNPRWYG